MREPYRVPTRNAVLTASWFVGLIVFSVVAVRAFAISGLPTAERAAGWGWFAGAWLVALVVALILQVPSLRRGTALPRNAQELARIRTRNLAAARPVQGVGVVAGSVLALFMAPSFWVVVFGVLAGLSTFMVVMTLLALFMRSGRAPHADHPGLE